MSSPYVGQYSTDLFNSSKRYRLAYQKGKALADSELREMRDEADSFVRQLVANNFPTGSSTNNGFKVIESVSYNVNNFTIMGGVLPPYDVNSAGVLFVDGYCLFLKSNIEYNQQDATGALTDDDYTKTSIPAIPAGPGVIKVYVDFYFAEVSATVGSEYVDSSLIVSGIGSATANRVRQVQDIRVTAIGGSIPSDGLDGNGIYHRYAQIATITRTTNTEITSGMIVDNRIHINSLQSYMPVGVNSGTATSILLANGSSIGDDTHRLSTVYMASTIDYKTNPLLFSNNGSERVRLTTSGSLGIGTNNPSSMLQLFLVGSDPVVTVQRQGGATGVLGAATNGTYVGSTNVGSTNAQGLFLKTNNTDRITILSDGKVGIGTSPVELFHVGAGTTKLDGNLIVNGTTTTVNTEVTVADMLSITQDDDQVGLSVVGLNTASVQDVVRINNYRNGKSLVIQQSGVEKVGITSTGYVGIGTTILSSGSTLEVKGEDFHQIWTRGTDSAAGGGVRVYNDNSQWGAFGVRGSATTHPNDAFVTSYTNKLHLGTGNFTPRLTIDTNGNIGVSTNSPGGLFHVYGLDKGIIVGTDYNNSSSGSIIKPTGAFFDIIGSNHTSSDINAIRFFTSNRTAGERVRITSTGNVGIGTTNPQSMLQIGQVTGVNKEIWVAGTYGSHEGAWLGTYDANGGGNLDLNAHSNATDSDSWRIMHDSATHGNLIFKFAPPQASRASLVYTEYMRLTTTGLGIGTTNPQRKLVITDNAFTGNPPTMRLDDSGNATTWIQGTPTGAIEFYCNDVSGVGPHVSAAIKTLVNTAAGEAHGLSFYVSNNSLTLNEAMNIHTSGAIGIATSANAIYQLLVEKDGDSGTIVSQFQNNNIGTSASAEIRVGAFGNNAIMRSYGDNHSTNSNLVEFGSVAGSTNVAFLSGGERVRILATNGFVGIGTTNPRSKLSVVGSLEALEGNVADRTLSMTINATQGTIETNFWGSGSYVPIVFKTQGNERVRINTDGKVGVGTTATELFHVGAGTARFDGGIVVNGTVSTINTETTSTDLLQINQDENQSALIIDKTGVGIGEVVTIDNHGTGNSFIISKAGVEKVRISALGLVCIGTDTPVELLNITNPTGAASINMIGNGGQSVVQIKDVSSPVDAKTIRFGSCINGKGRTHISSYNDAGSNYTKQNIMVFDHATGNVGVGSSTAHTNGMTGRFEVWNGTDLALGVGTTGLALFTGFVGIATTDYSPHPLEVWNIPLYGAQRALRVQTNGLVTVGTGADPTPASNTFMSKSAATGAASNGFYANSLVYGGTNSIQLGRTWGSNNQVIQLQYKQGDTLGTNTSSMLGFYYYGNNWGDGFVQKYGGNVGVGTVDPLYDLDVWGDVNVNSDINVHSIDGTKLKNYGSSTTQFDITLAGSSVIYTYDGNGTAPLFVTNGMQVGDYVDVQAANFNVLNKGLFVVTGVTETLFVVDVFGGGVPETNKTIGAGYIRTPGVVRTNWVGIGTTAPLRMYGGPLTGAEKLTLLESVNGAGLSIGANTSNYSSAIFNAGASSLNFQIDNGSGPVNKFQIGVNTVTSVRSFVVSGTAKLGVGTSTTPFTENFKVFGDGAVTGDLVVVGNTFLSSNTPLAFVGIGTGAVPTAVAGSSELFLYGDSANQFGIKIYDKTSANYSTIDHGNLHLGVTTGTLTSYLRFGAADNSKGVIIYQGSTGVMNFYTGGASRFILDDTTPNAKVNGDFVATGLVGVGTANVTGQAETIKIWGTGAVTGAFSKGSGTFLIDHPLDPKNKVLRHSFVESPEAVNIYRGRVIIEAGETEIIVELPKYFEALNKDVEYILTPIGKWASVYIKQEVSNNSFVIAITDPSATDTEISWTVSGVRKDAYMLKNPIIVEEEKTEKIGFKPNTYIHPECFA